MPGEENKSRLEILLEDNANYLQRLDDVFEDLFNLGIIQERKVRIGKEPTVKISLNKGVRGDFYGWEITVDSDLKEYANLLNILEIVNTALKEKFGVNTNYPKEDKK